MSSVKEPIDHQSRLKEALLALQKMRSRIEALENGRREPIAIIGIGCRFPGQANDPDSFWQLLHNGEDGIREVPADRWNIDEYYDPDHQAPGKMYVRHGGFIDYVDHFDPHFFGISPREARSMDPQQRLLLEVAWEALENAGQSPEMLSESLTGVFVGVTMSDYLQFQSNIGAPDLTGPYRITGNMLSSIPGRVAYTLGLRGPAMAVETACSSSLVAIYLAAQSLLTGDASMALAGGVNILLAPETTIGACKANMLAPDGRCKTFDSSANGFIRSEGCGLVVLKRLSDAKKHGDRILAVIRGVAVNHDGFSSGFTVPSKLAQEAVIKSALEKAGVSPALVSYVEAHGTGTSLGDPIEVRALGSIYGAKRQGKPPLRIGSLKTNIGHLECAAGVAGLIKVVLSMVHGEIPPHLHFNEPNPHIAWDKLPFEVPTRLTPWEPIDGRRIAGVSSFGASGINAHVILEAAPEQEPVSETSPQSTQILCLSAKTEAALKQLAARYTRFLTQRPHETLADICYTANQGRAHFSHRLAVRGDTPAGIIAGLSAFENGNAAANLSVGQMQDNEAPGVAFLFSGHGSQYIQMGRKLYETNPVFRQALEECEELLRPYLETPLLAVMYPDVGETHPLFAGMKYTQPALFALEYALAKLWISWGIEPKVVMGHSVGEYAAACIAGVMSLPDAIKLVAARGRMMDELPEAGSMAVVFADEATVAAAIAPYAEKVSIAVINSPDNIVISGESTIVDHIREELRQAGIKSRPVDIAQASHSPMVEPILDEFAKVAAEVTLSEPELDYVSCLTGNLVEEGEITGAEYWRRHLRQTVRFAEAIEKVSLLGCTVLVEIGPNPVLISIGKRNLPDGFGVWLPSLRKEKNDWDQVLTSLASLYTQGMGVEWESFYKDQPRRRVSLPTYPFQRQRYWSQPGLNQRGSFSSGPKNHPLLGGRLRSAVKDIIFETRLSLAAQPFLGDHVVRGRVILPATGFLEMAVAAVKDVLGNQTQVLLEDILIQEPLVIPPTTERILQTVVVPEKDNQVSIQIFSLDEGSDQWTLHLTGKAYGVPQAVRFYEIPESELLARYPEKITSAAYYQILAGRGLVFGAGFQGITELRLGAGETLAKIEMPASLVEEAGAFYLHPALLDAGLQPFAALLPEDGETYLPFNIAEVKLYDNPSRNMWSHVSLHKANVNGSGKITADVRLFNEAGQLAAEINQLTLVRAGRVEPDFERIKDWLYEINWQPLPAQDLASAHLITPEQIAQRVQSDVHRLSSAAEYVTYQEQVVPKLSKLCSGYIQNAFLEMGWNFEPGERFSLEALANRLRVARTHWRLLERLAGILAEDGLLEQDEAAWIACQKIQPPDTGSLAESLLKDYPASTPEVAMTRRFGERLASGLRGEQNPLELLFPGGSLSDAEKFYRDATFTSGFNQLVGKAVAAAAEALPRTRPVRILEIGAGTGGTTEPVLSALGGIAVEYTFTDVSTLFLNNARQKFAGYPGMRYRKLDIELDPQAQDFEPHAYDIIIAANVLHATRSLRRTLKHVQDMLAANGTLVLLEGTQKQAFIDLVVGLTEGWWLFEDTDLRPSYPLMPASRWLELFKEMGFSAAVSISGEQALSNQAVLVAQGPDIGRLEPARAGLGDWLIFTDRSDLGSEILQSFKVLGGDGLLVHTGEAYQALGPSEFVLNPTVPEDFGRLLEENGKYEFKGAIHLLALDTPAPVEDQAPPADLQEKLCGSVLYLTQALAKRGVKLPGGLWLVTRGIHQVQEAGDRHAPSPSPATLWGLGKVIVQEHPELGCVCIDLDPTVSTAEASLLSAAILNHGDEDQLALRGDAFYIPRVVRSQSDQGDAAAHPLEGRPYELVVTQRGTLDNLKFQPLNRRTPGPGEVEIQVYATGLGFRDVLNALGMYPGGGGLLGSECAGVVVATGPEVEGIEVGDEVIAVARGCFASHVITSANYVSLKPEILTFSEAASIPSAFFTTAFALKRLAKIKAGDRVLIHAAAGGVGIAAVQLALQAGAEVFATAGSPEKRLLVKSLGAHYVMDSRTLDFAGEILALTDGKGVDIVLNSLADEFIPKSIEVLAAAGCFLEIGKRGIWSHSQFAEARPQAAYHIIDLLEEYSRDPQLISALFQELLPAFIDGTLKPLPMQVFPIADAAGAFRYMAQAKHIGKILVQHQAHNKSAYLRRGATYLITGGLGGLGLEVSRWLVAQGAKNLVLVGRRPPSPDAQTLLGELEQSGAQIRVIQADVSIPDQIKRVIAEVEERMPPLRGVFHASGQLDDGVLVQQNWARFAPVFASKVDAGWNLHQATRHLPLDFFILFSSANSIFGSPGQGNHVAATTYLDSLGYYLHARGIPTLTIGWGPWSQVGAAASRKIGNRMTERGIGLISPELGILTLDYLMDQAFSKRASSNRGPSPIQVGVAPVNAARFAGQYADHRVPPFYSELMQAAPNGAVKEEISEENLAAGPDLWDRLLAAPPSKRSNLILAFVHNQVIKVLGLEPSFLLNRNQPLQELGLDSLMAVELRNLLSSGLKLDHPLPATLVFDYTTTEALANYLLKEIFPAGQAAAGEQAAPAHAGVAQDAPGQATRQESLEEMDQMTDEEAEAQLLSELETLQKKE